MTGVITLRCKLWNFSLEFNKLTSSLMNHQSGIDTFAKLFILKINNIKKEGMNIGLIL